MAARIYLDHNATTRPLPEVIEAMDRCWRDGYANPGSRHAEGRAARRALESARETIAVILGAEPEEVIFTSGGTEASNLAVLGLAGRPLRDPLAPGFAGERGWGEGDAARGPAPSLRATPPTPPSEGGGPEAPLIALTAGEHPATMEACRHLTGIGFRLHTLAVGSNGLLRCERYDRLSWDRLRLVTVILAHNETGVIQDVSPLAELCARFGVPLHLDAVQAVGKIPIDFHALHATALSLGAHKFHGPRGVGALLLRKGVGLAPLLFGGHQESARRPGTEPVALAVGMATALESWHGNREMRTRQLAALRDRLQARLCGGCPPAVANGADAPRLPNTLNIAFPGVDGEALLVALDLEGIACSLGSTCASGSAEPAPALVAMGCPPKVYKSSVRFSLGIDNTEAEIDEAIARISGVVGRLRQPGTGSTC